MKDYIFLNRMIYAGGGLSADGNMLTSLTAKKKERYIFVTFNFLLDCLLQDVMIMYSYSFPPPGGFSLNRHTLEQKLSTLHCSICRHRE